MLAILQKDNQDMLGSDSLMYIDGRLSVSNAIEAVKERNDRYRKNFPHKIADSFYFVDERLNAKSKPIKL